MDNDAGILPEDFILKPVRHTELIDWLERRLALAVALSRRKRRARRAGAAHKRVRCPMPRSSPPCSKWCNLGFYRGIMNKLAAIERQQPAPRLLSPRCACWRGSSSSKPWGASLPTRRPAMSSVLEDDPAPHLDQTLDRANSDVVLIVDDVPDNLSVLHDALDESGYTVLVATSGEAALQRALQALPDIVLLDAMMPGMDGFEVAAPQGHGRDGPHPHHLHDRPHRDRTPGGRAGGRWRGLRHQAHQAQGSDGAHGRAPAGRPPRPAGGAAGRPGAQCARCLRLCQHHRAHGRTADGC
jgi:hypothetical protein